MNAGVKAVLLDFGGVIADEGFKNGLYQIARDNGLDEEAFFEKAREAIHDTGYLLGTGTEKEFWDELRRETGIRGADRDLRETILKGFIVRPWMLEVIGRLKSLGVRVAILSDQTDWLDELEESMRIFGLFERVFNSYHLGKSKLSPSIFTDVLGEMGLAPHEALFVDDTPGHVERARSMGLNAILFKGREDFLHRLASYCPGLPEKG
ncbi:MAG TPA: HAD family phosphatase [Deltaproteobacteria bacterium]|jgi:putative hydrolase of the HAD superfamily|nr:HAD family phosphatase [Deltaproteobacteria bacterium]HOI06058.1 HAD family phosphatase [Deltaproteobacteria bacterium]